jgi:nitroreductase
VTDSLDSFAALALARRTSLLVDRERAVPDELTDRLCQLATFAPNHKKTWPWRFAVVTGQGRRTLGETAADAMRAAGVDDDAKLDKTRSKYLRAPTIVVVGTAPNVDPHRHREDRDAVAAGVQTLLLGATAAGLSSFWSSCPFGANDAVAAFSRFEPGTDISALVYLGWPVDEVPVPSRDAPKINHVST